MRYKYYKQKVLKLGLPILIPYLMPPSLIMWQFETFFDFPLHAHNFRMLYKKQQVRICKSLGVDR